MALPGISAAFGELCLPEETQEPRKEEVCLACLGHPFLVCDSAITRLIAAGLSSQLPYLS